jgi:hypothetical protein
MHIIWISTKLCITPAEGIKAYMNKYQSQSHVMTDGWVSQHVKFTLKLVTRYYFLSESCCVVSVRCPLCWEDGSVSCQSLSSVKVEVTLQPTVSRPVSLGVRRPSGTHDQFYFLLEIFFRQFWVCNFVAPSLTRGRVCNLLYSYFWALQEQSLLGRSPAELTAIFYCLIWDSPNLEGQVPVFISPRNKVAQLYPRALGSLFCRYSGGTYSNPPPHGCHQCLHTYIYPQFGLCPPNVTL